MLPIASRVDCGGKGPSPCGPERARLASPWKRHSLASVCRSSCLYAAQASSELLRSAQSDRGGFEDSEEHRSLRGQRRSDSQESMRVPDTWTEFQ